MPPRNTNSAALPKFSRGRENDGEDAAEQIEEREAVRQVARLPAASRAVARERSLPGQLRHHGDAGEGRLTNADPRLGA